LFEVQEDPSNLEDSFVVVKSNIHNSQFIIHDS